MGFFSELKRRNVFRVAAAYAVSAWLIAQVAELVLDGIEAPAWIFKCVLLLLALGFPIALIFAWAYELTPEGIKPEREVDRTNSITKQTGKRLNLVIIGVLLVACSFLLVDKFVLQPSQTERNAAITIAVLPFENRSSLADDSYFVDGIHDDLLTRLSQVNSWRVISRTSVEGMSASNLSIPEVGERLGATHIVEGSVQRAAHRIRVVIQLIDVRSDSHIWAPDPYDRALTAENVFAIQTEMATSIARSLQTVLSIDDRDRLARIGTRSLEAYDKYLRGRELTWLRTGESVDSAVVLFQEAVEIDPDYADAWAGLGDAYRFQITRSDVPLAEALPRAESALRRAIDLDPGSGEAWAGLGNTLRFKREFDEADVAFRRGIELARNYSNGRMWYGLLLSDQGRAEEAIQQFEQTLLIDPLHPVVRTNLYPSLLDVGRFEEAMAVIDEQLAFFPEDAFAHYVHAAVSSYYFGRFDIAIKPAEKSYSLDAEGPSALALANFYIDLGDIESAKGWMAAHAGGYSLEAWAEETSAYIALFSGQSPVAYEHAERAVSTKPPDSSGPPDKSLLLLRDKDLAGGRPHSALQRYQAWYPGLFAEQGQRVTTENCRIAADIAWVLLQSGDKSGAQALAHGVKATAAGHPRAGRLELGIASARASVVLGNVEAALGELSASIDEGWRIRWMYVFDYDPVFASLRDNPEFAELRERVASDMSDQLETIRKKAN